jgi:2-dehydro-3-deoxygluconokinase
MSKVLCFGELLLRYSPELGGKWISDRSMPVFIGGAELNAATALALWKVPVAYCTALPDHYLSHEIIDFIESKRIDSSRIQFSGSRIGSYFLPQGADLKAAGVIYDRAHSSFWDLKPGEVDWDNVLEGVSWFHFSAISPALNAHAALVCREALEAASSKNITISVDLNYRAKLWQYGAQPVDIMPDLVQYCNLVMGNIWAAEKMLGMAVSSKMSPDKESYLEQSARTSAAIMKAFPKCTQVANTFRFDQGNGIQYYASLFTGDQMHVSSEHGTDRIIDKVGSGDTFMAGLIYGNYHRLPPQETINFSAAAAFSKLFVKGDATTKSADEIKKLYTTHAS